MATTTNPDENEEDEEEEEDENKDPDAMDWEWEDPEYWEQLLGDDMEWENIDWEEDAGDYGVVVRFFIFDKPAVWR